MTLDPTTRDLLRRAAATHWPNTVGHLAAAIRAWHAAGCPDLPTSNQSMSGRTPKRVLSGEPTNQPTNPEPTMKNDDTTTTTTPIETPDERRARLQDTTTDDPDQAARLQVIRNGERRARHDRRWRERDDLLARVATMEIDDLRTVASRQAANLIEIRDTLERFAVDRVSTEGTIEDEAYGQILRLQASTRHPLDLGLASFDEIRREHLESMYAPGADFDPDATDARFDLLFTADNNHTRRTVRGPGQADNCGQVVCRILTTLEGWRLEATDWIDDPGGYALVDQMRLSYVDNSTTQAKVEWVKFVRRHMPDVDERDLSLPPSVCEGLVLMTLRLNPGDLMPINWKRRIDRACHGSWAVRQDWAKNQTTYILVRILAALEAQRASNARRYDDRVGRFQTDGQSRLWLAISEELDTRLRPYTLRFQAFDEWDADDDEIRHQTYGQALDAAKAWLDNPAAMGAALVSKLVVSGPSLAADEVQENPRYRPDLVDQDEDDGGAASEAKWIAGSAFGDQGLADLGGLDVDGGDK